MTVVTQPQLSPTLRSLFALEVVAAVLDGTSTAACLLPAEARFLGSAAAPSRIQEFTGGRLCARLALSEFGILDFPIEMAADRRPLWPDGFVGSITHTAGHCAAVVARVQNIMAIGLDTERAGRIKPELWHRICVPEEISWLDGLSQLQRELASTLIFCAKEAFYKCQYPLTFERLGFGDARIEVSTWDANGGTFRVHSTNAIRLSEYASSPWSGKFAVHDTFVTAGLAIAAASC